MKILVNGAWRETGAVDLANSVTMHRGMMREVMMRRFSRALAENPERDGAEIWPEMVGRGR